MRPFKSTTVTEALTRTRAFLCERLPNKQLGPLYEAELSLRTYRVKFWRDSRYVGSLRWNAKREHCEGDLDLLGYSQYNPEFNALLLRALEEELRKALHRAWAVLYREPVKTVERLAEHQEDSLLRGLKAWAAKVRHKIGLDRDLKPAKDSSLPLCEAAE